MLVSDKQLIEQLRADNSVSNVLYVANWAMQNTTNLERIAKVAFSNDQKLADRAFWVIEKIVVEQPNLFEPYVDELVRVLVNGQPTDPQLRIGLKILTLVDYNEEHEGNIICLCTDIMCDTKRPIAVRCNALELFALISKKYPPLQQELKLTISQLQHEDLTAGFKARIKKVFRGL